MQNPVSTDTESKQQPLPSAQKQQDEQSLAGGLDAVSKTEPTAALGGSTPQASDDVSNDVSNDHGRKGSLFTRRQMFAASFAGLVLGVGTGMAFTTKTFIADEQKANKPTTVELGFVNDMLDHHDQAVEMSLIALGLPGVGANTRQFATEVLVFQRYEIGLLEGHLNNWGEERAAENRRAMAWMGMGTSVQAMPGMASPNELERLKNASGTGADREFLTLMRAHHKGGVHMAEYAADRAKNDDIVTLAARMAYNQNLEISEYTLALNKLPNA